MPTPELRIQRTLHDDHDYPLEHTTIHAPANHYEITTTKHTPTSTSEPASERRTSSHRIDSSSKFVLICGYLTGKGCRHVRRATRSYKILPELPTMDGDDAVADLLTEAAFDLRTDSHDDVLTEVEKWLGVQLDRSSSEYGRQGVTAGFRTDRDTWVRIQWRRMWVINGPAWTGAECASVLRHVAKPDLLRSVRWRDDARGMVWRADEMELILSPAVSSSGVVGSEPVLSDSWWRSLKTSFAALAAHKTERVGMSSAHLIRRIKEVFGDSVDTTIDEWVTAHADIHWGNLTAPDCYLLDWEDWGVAPRGFDAAMLWGHSLRVPKLADHIQHEFQVDLTTRSGKLAQLVFCANVIRVSARRSEPNPLLEPSKNAAYALISELQTRR